MHVSTKGAALGGALALSVLAGGAAVLAAGTPTTATLMKSHPAMRQVLHYGSKGHWVMTLQADLHLLGYSGPVNGIFAFKTEDALKAFQHDYGFEATGVTSAAVWQEILAGFHIVPPVPGHAAPKSLHGTSQPTAPSSGSGSQSSSLGGAYSPNVLPAQFPTGGTPVSEPSLPNASAGLQGAFNPTVKTIDGRPVLRAYHMVATSYGPSLADNYPYGPVDAFGNPLQNGMVAVDPSVIPLGTVVYVTGYHDNYLPASGFLGKAMDTGGAIKGDRVDIFINANPTVINDFGVQQVTVYVLGN